MSITLNKDKNDLEYLLIKHSSGSLCECYLFGAHITKFIDNNGNSILYMSEKSYLDGKNPIRGGIPIVFPQFNMRGSLPKHGFARNNYWKYIGERITSDEVVAILALKDNEETRKIWDFNFELEYHIHLTDNKLTCELKYFIYYNIELLILEIKNLVFMYYYIIILILMMFMKLQLKD